MVFYLYVIVSGLQFQRNNQVSDANNDHLLTRCRSARRAALTVLAPVPAEEAAAVAARDTVAALPTAAAATSSRTRTAAQASFKGNSIISFSII